MVRQHWELYMSERPPDRGPSENSSKDGSEANYARQTMSPARAPAFVSQPASRTLSMSPPIVPRQAEGAFRGIELPPLSASSSASGAGSLPPVTRMGRVSSILNPPQADEASSSRRRKASQLNSPASSTQSLPSMQLGGRPAQHTTGYPNQSPFPQPIAPAEAGSRRILTPRSPSLHRAASVGQLNPPVGTISAHTNPFPTSPRGRTYRIEPGSAGAPPLPSYPTTNPNYEYATVTSPARAARRASPARSGNRALSGSVSPSSSYSSYGQAGPRSPGGRYDTSSIPVLSTPYAEDSQHDVAGDPMRDDHQRQMGVAVSSSGSQNVYQMLTLETTAGSIQLPVDVQAASRVADEKRRRNAGASARFRQRRKEKEKEASTTISRLEQQVKESSEDADFYRRERDFFASILRHVPGAERHFPRPGSPRHRRPSNAPRATHEHIAYAGALERDVRSPVEERHVRRRTSTYSIAQPPIQHQAAPMQPPAVPLDPGFPAMGSHHPSSAHPSPSGPLPSPQARTILPLPNQAQGFEPPRVLQAVPQTGPMNPYAVDRRPPGPPAAPREQ